VYAGQVPSCGEGLVEEPEVPVLLATFTDWNLETYIDEGVFRFTPPSGTEEKPFEPAAR